MAKQVSTDLKIQAVKYYNSLGNIDRKEGSYLCVDIVKNNSQLQKVQYIMKICTVKKS